MGVATRILFTSLFLIALPSFALAGADCNKDNARHEDLGCATRMLDSADKALNDAYKALLAKIGPDGKETLKEAQRAWIQFRDADTALAYQIPAKEVPLAGLSPQNTKLI